jgi:hypothetical protein
MSTPKPNVEKVVIRPYLTQTKDEKAGKDFTIPINPETYSQAYKIESKSKSTGGNEGSTPEYKFTTPEQLKLDFTLDNTGTIEGNILDGTPLPKQVESLLNVVYKMQGKSHRPSILQIQWDLFTFDCVLASIDINYVLFKQNGEPLRAKISATFTQHKDPKLRARKEDKQSPDLTHTVKIAQDDNLPLLSYRNYGDPSLYVQLAYVNRLMSIRSLKTGDELLFPPVRSSEKQSLS